MAEIARVKCQAEQIEVLMRLALSDEDSDARDEAALALYHRGIVVCPPMVEVRVRC